MPATKTIFIFLVSGDSAEKLNSDGKARKVYGNQRAEAWSYTAKRLSLREAYIPAHIDKVLKNQLCWPKYNYKLGKTYVESKDDILPLLEAFKEKRLRIPRWEVNSFNPFELMAFEKLATLP